MMAEGRAGLKTTAYKVSGAGFGKAAAYELVPPASRASAVIPPGRLTGAACCDAFDVLARRLACAATVVGACCGVAVLT